MDLWDKTDNTLDIIKQDQGLSLLFWFSEKADWCSIIYFQNILLIIPPVSITHYVYIWLEKWRSWLLYQYL